MKHDPWHRLVTSAPVNKTAAFVVSQKGCTDQNYDYMLPGTDDELLATLRGLTIEERQMMLNAFYHEARYLNRAEKLAQLEKYRLALIRARKPRVDRKALLQKAGRHVTGRRALQAARSDKSFTRIWRKRRSDKLVADELKCFGKPLSAKGRQRRNLEIAREALGEINVAAMTPKWARCAP